MMLATELNAVEAELSSLRTYIDQWAILPASHGADASQTNDASQTSQQIAQRGRGSIVDLDTLYRSQLAELHRRVDHAARLVPHQPGRHVVYTAHALTELEPRTEHPLHPLELIILDDRILLAPRKSTSATTKPAADRCFLLADCKVVDVEHSPRAPHAISIARASQQTLIACPNADEKRAILAAFKKVAIELIGRKRAKQALEANQRKSLHPSAFLNPMAAAAANDLEEVRSMNSSAYALLTADEQTSTSKGSMRWIEEFADELSTFLALQQYDQVVAKIETGSHLLPSLASDAVASAALRLRISAVTDQLTAALVQQLSDPDIRKTKVITLSALLLRLGKGDLALRSFLSARSHALEIHLASLSSQKADLKVYVTCLALITFTVIRHSTAWCLAAFEENAMASGLMQWAGTEMEKFASLFAEHAYAPHVSSQAAEEALEIVWLQAKKVSTPDFDFMALSDPTIEPRRLWHGLAVHTRTSLDRRHFLRRSSPAKPTRRHASAHKGGRQTERPQTI